MSTDRQNVTITVAVTTQVNGCNWEGTVELDGPFHEDMVTEAVLLSQALVERAFPQSDPLPAEISQSVDTEARKEHLNDDAEAEIAEAKFAADAHAANPVGLNPRNGPKRRTQIHDLPDDQGDELPF